MCQSQPLEVLLSVSNVFVSRPELLSCIPSDLGVDSRLFVSSTIQSVSNRLLGWTVLPSVPVKPVRRAVFTSDWGDTHYEEGQWSRHAMKLWSWSLSLNTFWTMPWSNSSSRYFIANSLKLSRLFLEWRCRNHRLLLLTWVSFSVERL